MDNLGVVCFVTWNIFNNKNFKLNYNCKLNTEILSIYFAVKKFSLKLFFYNSGMDHIFKKIRQ